MDGTTLAALVRKYTGTDSTSYTSADLLVDANNAKNDIGLLIEKRNEQKFVLPSLFDLVTSSITAREYPLPDDILSKLVTVELAFVVESPLKYVPCRPYPGGLQQALIDTDGLTEAKIIALFSNSKPFYFITRNGIYVLSASIIAVTNGGKIRYKSFPADLANLTGSTGLHLDPTSTTFGIPLQFHELWARKISINWKSERPYPIPLSPIENNWGNDMEIALQSIANDDAAQENFGSIPDYNNGFDL